MRPTNIGIRLRELLLANPSGLSTRELSKLDGAPQDLIMAALERNYGFYVGGWEKAVAGKYRAIWRVIVVPASAPKPMGYSESYDAEEARIQRQIEGRKEINAQLVAQRRRARVKLKAELEREKIETKKRKAEAKAEMQRIQLDVRRKGVKRKSIEPAGGEGYEPQLTRWAPLQPWPEGVRP